MESAQHQGFVVKFKKNAFSSHLISSLSMLSQSNCFLSHCIQ